MLNGISFQPGVQFNLALGFGNAARIYAGPKSGENTSVNGNFTMVLTGLTVIDSNGAPVSGFTINSASGTSYGVNGVVVPEPSPAGLFTAGIAALVVMKIRKLVKTNERMI